MNYCKHCGMNIPEWSDLPAALEEALQHADVPRGVRPMLAQAIGEIRQLRIRLHDIRDIAEPEPLLGGEALKLFADKLRMIRGLCG